MALQSHGAYFKAPEETLDAKLSQYYPPCILLRYRENVV